MIIVKIKSTSLVVKIILTNLIVKIRLTNLIVKIIMKILLLGRGEGARREYLTRNILKHAFKELKTYNNN